MINAFGYMQISTKVLYSSFDSDGPVICSIFTAGQNTLRKCISFHLPEVFMATMGISNNSTAAEQTIGSAVIRPYADAQTCLPWGSRFSSSFQCPLDIAFIGVPFTTVLVNPHAFRQDNIITTAFDTGFIDSIDSLFENLGRVTWVAMIDFLFMRDSIICYSVYAMAIPSVRLSVCLSHGWISQKRLKLGSRNFHHTKAPSL